MTAYDDYASSIANHNDDYVAYDDYVASQLDNATKSIAAVALELQTAEWNRQSLMKILLLEE